MNNALRQQRFRHRQKEKIKIVTYQASPLIPANVLLVEKQVANHKGSKTQKRREPNTCHFCGRQCGDLFRVGFLKKRTTYPYRPKTAIGETPNEP